jgi:hypothetical protein
MTISFFMVGYFLSCVVVEPKQIRAIEPKIAPTMKPSRYGLLVSSRVIARTLRSLFCSYWFQNSGDPGALVEPV